jgi:transcription-repair coupling factor (superfamily II helicase)
MHATAARGLLRELRRGGQSIFVHNEVEGIEKIAREDLAELCPRRRSAWATARCASATWNS